MPSDVRLGSGPAMRAAKATDGDAPKRPPSGRWGATETVPRPGSHDERGRALVAGSDVASDRTLMVGRALRDGEPGAMRRGGYANTSLDAAGVQRSSDAIRASNRSRTDRVDPVLSRRAGFRGLLTTYMNSTEVQVTLPRVALPPANETV